MVRSTLYWLVGLGALGLALWAGNELRRAQDAAGLTREARLVLDAPLARAPELSGIEAARAVMLLEDSLRTHDDEAARGLLWQARALDDYLKGRPDRAAQHLQQARDALGEQPDLLVLAATLAADRGELEAAEKVLERGLSAHGRHERLRLSAVDLALDREQPARALGLLGPLLEAHPEMAGLHNRRGLAREAAGDLEAALQSYLRAAELDPALHQPLVNVGRLRHAAGEYRAAEDAFSAAIGRAEAQAEAWLGRGLSRRAQGDLAGGALDVEKARKLAPGAAGPLLAQADLDAAAGELGTAIDRYLAVLVITPDDPVAWLKLGNAQVRNGAPGEARSSFERALELQPSMAAAHNGLGAALLQLGQHEEASAMLVRASELDRTDPNPLLNLARLRRTQGDTHGAAQAEEAALALR